MNLVVWLGRDYIRRNEEKGRIGITGGIMIAGLWR